MLDDVYVYVDDGYAKLYQNTCDKYLKNAQPRADVINNFKIRITMLLWNNELWLVKTRQSCDL